MFSDLEVVASQRLHCWCRLFQTMFSVRSPHCLDRDSIRAEVQSNAPSPTVWQATSRPRPRPRRATPDSQWCSHSHTLVTLDTLALRSPCSRRRSLDRLALLHSPCSLDRLALRSPCNLVRPLAWVRRTGRSPRRKHRTSPG